MSTPGLRRAVRRTGTAFAVAAALAAGWLGAAGGATARQPAAAPDVQAEAAIVVDAESGAVIAADDPRERRPIASATKLMTALLTLEESGPVEVFVAGSYEPAPIESQIGLRDGERMAVRDLLVALLLESANDAAVTLAEGIAGDTRAFVAEMNARADRLGLDDTSYANPIGFDDPRNYSTAADLANLARRLMEERRFRDIVEEPSLELRSGDVPRTVENRNELVGESPLVDGIKTGHTLDAGYVLVGSAADDGNRVVSVVLGAAGEEARDQESLALMEYGLAQFRERRAVRAGQRVGEAAVADHGGETVELTAASGASVTVLRGEEIELRVDAPTEIEGPLPAGEEVGSLALVRRGDVVGTVPVLTASRVPGPGLMTSVATTLRDRLWVVVAIAAILGGVLALAVVRLRRSRTRPESRSAT
jgi:D-alanyl-D-alanine carboxypeptidase (penicillin-binding protein 5/6)